MLSTLMISFYIRKLLGGTSFVGFYIVSIYKESLDRDPREDYPARG